MATAQINRSLTTICTELLFLLDSNVVTPALHDALVASLPKRYAKDDPEWDIDKLRAALPETPGATEPVPVPTKVITPVPDPVAETTAAFSVTTITEVPPPSYSFPSAKKEKADFVCYCKALYSFEPCEMGDLQLKEGDVLAVVEELSRDWWRGYKLGETASVAGIFPSNYVCRVSKEDFMAASSSEKPAALFNAPSQPPPQKFSYNPGYSYSPSPINHGHMQPQIQSPHLMQPAVQPVPVQPVAPVQAVQPLYQSLPPVQQESTGLIFGNKHPHLSSIGSKLGDAAVFGAGASIGLNLVNSIFK